ncbi:MAG: hypothetical protein HPY94_04680 [Clostridia bacterium]|nr:hypothetical protein [Clostridia bacterium]
MQCVQRRNKTSGGGKPCSRFSYGKFTDAGERADFSITAVLMCEDDNGERNSSESAAGMSVEFCGEISSSDFKNSAIVRSG